MDFLSVIGDLGTVLCNAHREKIWSDKGFEDGASGKRPSVIFVNADSKRAYDRGYERGQGSAVARAISGRLGS